MIIRKANGDEMLELWGYGGKADPSPTASFFYSNILSGNSVFYTVDNEGELIGELYAFLDLPDKDFANGTDTAYLCAFRIKKEYRGKGLGGRLMAAALCDLKSSGFTRATIGVDDERNKRLYERMGFNTYIKTCYLDPCAMTDDMQPEFDEGGYTLLAKEL